MKRIGASRSAVAGAMTLAIVSVLSGDAAAQQACTAPKTRCAGHSGYYAPADDIDRLTAVADPILHDVRTCLDGIGAKHVPSVLIIRWDSEGKPVDVKIDVPGYESLPCVQKAHHKLATLQNPRETAIRCEFGCAPPPTPKSAPPPVVVAPPAPAPAPVSTPVQPTPVQPTPSQPSPPPGRRPEQPEYEKVWYGYQTLIADAASATLFAGGLFSKSGGATLGGYLGFVLATPIVHMVHGNIGPGFGSIGLRLLMPVIGIGVGAIAGVIIGGTSGSGSFDRFADGANGAVNGAVIGGLIGAAGCVLIDAAGFAYSKERVDNTPITLGPRRPQPSFTLAPSLGVQKDRASFGVVGRF
jgi:hypothetical protein